LWEDLSAFTSCEKLAEFVNRGWRKAYQARIGPDVFRV